MKTTVPSKDVIALLAELPHQDKISAGQEFEIKRVDGGEYQLILRNARSNEGVVDADRH